MDFFKKNKRVLLTVFTIFSLTVVFVFFFDVQPANAWLEKVGDMITTWFWRLVLLPINIARLILGYLMMWFLKLLVIFAKYNNFVDHDYVTAGWKMTRDVVNMFFILGLLFIAFTMVLKIEKYPVNKFMPRLLIMAILVNFSKTICGVIIDFFQVIMLTFVNSFKDISEAAIFKGLGVMWWFDKSESPDPSAKVEEDAGMWAVFAALLGVIYLTVACIVILIFSVILAFRIVALWILVVLSPIAFFSYVFAGEGGQVGQISGQWWGKFLNYCMIGPFLAFFLWLSISSLAQMRASQLAEKSDYGPKTNICSDSAACNFENMIGFFMSIVLLIGGLVYSAEFGVAGSSWGASKVNNLRGRAAGALDNTAKRVGGAAVGAAMYMPRRGMRAVGAKVGGAASGVMAGLSDRYVHGPDAAKTRIGRTINAARQNRVIGGVMRGGREFLRATTKEGASDVYKETKGKYQRRVGPKGLAEEEARDEINEKMVKNIEQEEGAIDSQKTYNEKLSAAKDAGDYRRHRALLTIGARNGFMQKKDVDDFKENFTGKGKMYKGEDDMSWVRMTQKLEKDHYDKTGEHLPLNRYFLDEEGQVIPREEYDKTGRHKETMEKIKDQTPDESVKLAKNKNTGDIFSAKGEEMKETRMSNLLGLAANHERTGKFGKAARQQLQQRIGQIVESDEGKELLQKMIDDGKIDEQDLNNLDTFYWKLGGNYNEADGRPLDDSKDVKSIKARSDTGDKKHSDKINSLKAMTKSSLGRKLSDAGDVSKVGDLKTDSLDEIESSLGNIDVNATITPTSDSKLNSRLTKRQNNARKDKKDIGNAIKLNKALSDPTLNVSDEKAVKDKIKATLPSLSDKQVNKAYRDFRKGEFTKGSIKKKAKQFKADYGKLDDKTKEVKVSIESSTYDDAVNDFNDTIIDYSTGKKDMGDLETSAEEAILASETMLNKTETAGKQLNIEVDAKFKKDKKKLDQIAKRFRGERKEDEKKQIASELFKHIDEMKQKFKEDSSQKSYFSGEWKKDQVGKRLDDAGESNLKFDAELQEEIKKAMKKEIGGVKRDYVNDADIDAAIAEAKTKLGK